MPSAVNHRDYLLVAGGGKMKMTCLILKYTMVRPGLLNICLPGNPGPYMKSACPDGDWYLSGFLGDKVVYSASLDSFITMGSSKNSEASMVWKGFLMSLNIGL